MKIGIIGVGVVGGAVREGSKHCELVVTYDKFQADKNSHVDQLGATDLCFICVPTPTRDVKQDLSAVVDALTMLSSSEYAGVVAIKSTVMPGTTDLLQNQFPGLRIVHNPEFLSEKTARSDYKGQSIALVSGSRKDTDVFADYMYAMNKGIQVIRNADFRITELAKYIHNCTLAVKLSFLNEIFDLAGSESNYRAAAAMASYFGNIGRHHAIPGPDGKRGWGGMCFPKDTQALLSYAQQSGVQMPTLNGAIETNAVLRPEEMIGKNNG